jgi:hypothetical protein
VEYVDYSLPIVSELVATFCQCCGNPLDPERSRQQAFDRVSAKEKSAGLPHLPWARKPELTMVTVYKCGRCQAEWGVAPVPDKVAAAGTGPDPAMLLVACLKDEHWDVRLAACDRLGLVGNAEAVQPLVAMLADPEWRVCRGAMDALAVIGDERAVQPLTEVLLQSDPRTSRKAADCLDRLGWSAPAGALRGAYRAAVGRRASFESPGDGVSMEPDGPGDSASEYEVRAFVACQVRTIRTVRQRYWATTGGPMSRGLAEIRGDQNLALEALRDIQALPSVGALASESLRAEYDAETDRIVRAVIAKAIPGTRRN